MSARARILIAAAAAAASGSAALAATTEIDRPPRSTTLAARGAVLAYSRWDDAAAGYRLRIAVGDAPPADVAVAPRSVPFDVRVGRDRMGGVVLVYSRCRREPLADVGIPPEHVGGPKSGCTLRVATPAGGERHIRGAGPGVLPAVDGRWLAFVRYARNGRPQVVVRPFDRPGAPRLVLNPPRRILSRPAPAAIDLLGRRLAVTWRGLRTGEVPDSLLRVTDIGTRASRTVRRLGGGGQTAHAIVGATLLPHGALAWAEICGGDPSGCPHTRRFGRLAPPRGVRFTPAPSSIEAFAATPTTAWALEGCRPGTWVDGTTCSLVRLVPPPGL